MSNHLDTVRQCNRRMDRRTD